MKLRLQSAFVIFLFSFSAYAMETPPSSSIDGSVKVNERTVLLMGNESSQGCGSFSCPCGGESYISLQGQLLTGFWAEHRQLYNFCLPCIRQQDHILGGIFYAGIGLVILGVSAWVIYEYLFRRSSDGQPADNMNPRWKKPDFHWVLSDRVYNSPKQVLACVVRNTSEEEVEFQLNDRYRPYYRSFHLLCAGEEPLEQIYCIDALEKSVQSDFSQVALLELLLATDWMQSWSSMILPQLWSNWFQDEIAESRQLCLDRGNIYFCDEFFHATTGNETTR